MAACVRRVFGFLDIDAFECQLWQIEFPNTRGKPCVVATSTGRIVSVTPEAKILGICRSQTPTVRHAKKVYPGLHIFWKPNEYGKPDSKKTRRGTHLLLDTVKKFCSKHEDITVELASSDEIYLDISAEVTRQVNKYVALQRGKKLDVDEGIIVEQRLGAAVGPFKFDPFYGVSQSLHHEHILMDQVRLVFGAFFMKALSEHIFWTVGLTSSCGVALNRLMAKVGCNLNKPGKTTILTNESWGRVARRIDISQIPGLGGLKGEKLKEKFGVATLYNLRHVSLPELQAEFPCETAVHIFSKARGKCNQPVTEKYIKDKLCLNKPKAPVINNMTLLQTTIRNLCEELQFLLYEEYNRHGRVASLLKVDFLINLNEATVNGNEKFEIESYDSFFKVLYAKVYILIRDQIVPNTDFEVTELSYVVKGFVSADESDDNSSVMSANIVCLDQSCARKLRVKCGVPSVIPSIGNRIHLDTFGTKGNKQWKEVVIKKLRDDSTLSSFKDIDLSIGYEHDNSLLIQNQLEFYELRHKSFLKWFEDFKFAEKLKIGEIQRPDFVGFCGRFSDTLKTPVAMQYADWEIYAMNIGGIIFLWDEKIPKGIISIECYYGLKFELLMRREDNQEDICNTNEITHSYVVTTANIGNHTVLAVSDIDAEDDAGKWIEITVRKETEDYATAAKQLKLWSQCIVPGIEQALVGRRNANGKLLNTKLWKLDQISDELGDKASQCIVFEDRFLSWIKTHLQSSNKNVVMRYSWVCGEYYVHADQVKKTELQNLTIPRLYSNLLPELEGLYGTF